MLCVGVLTGMVLFMKRGLLFSQAMDAIRGKIDNQVYSVDSRMVRSVFTSLMSAVTQYSFNIFFNNSSY